MNFLDDIGLSNKLWALIKRKFGEKVDKTTKINGHPLSSDVTLTKSDVGLGNVNNTSDLDKPVSTAQASAIAEAAAAGTTAQTNLNAHIGDISNPHEVTKLQIGLGKVTNDAQVKRTEMGKASGVATLDANGKVPSSQLPSYVDDVLEYTNKASFPTSGETGKIYVALDTNLTYRWSGTAYVEISPSIGLGETESTAYPGNKGKKNADDIAAHKADTNNPHSVTKEQVGLGKVNNTADNEKPVSTAQATAIKVVQDDLTSHKLREDNPHKVSKAQIGLSKVDNTADIDKPISTATDKALGTKVDKVDGKGLSTNDFTTALKTKLEGIASGAQVNTVTGVKGDAETAYRTGNVNITKTNIGLGNVDNTSDASKPVSTAQATAIADAKKAGTDAQTNLNVHKSATNPHNITKSTVGLGNVDNVKQLPASEKGAASGVATLDANSKIAQNIDAGKITSGTISIDRLPKGALERLTVVANAAARKALTTATVQNGDTVKETDTGLMYYVKDETKLSTDAGWEVYTAGSAASVPWTGVTGKPSTFTPATHTHTKAQITDFPTALKNPAALTLSLNGTSQGAYDGSAAKSINITAGSVGAAAASHTHTKSQITDFPATWPWDSVSGKPTDYPNSSKLNVDGSNGTADGINTLINKLSIADANPLDGDYYISQAAGGGTTTTTYHRRPVSKLWNYIKKKCDNLYATINTTFKLVNTESGVYTNIIDDTIANKIKDTCLQFWCNAAGWFTIKAKRYISSVATGTAPLEVISTTVVNNLNADMVDGIQGSNIEYYVSDINIKVGSTPGKITTAQFITKLTELGAFNHSSWSTKLTWDYANNDTITDTDCGNIQLAGAVIEKVGNSSLYTIRVTTAPATSNSSIHSAVFIYRNHGSQYNPGWTRLVNTTDKIANATNADIATKLGTATVGNSVKPTYLNAGTPTACDFTLNDLIPAFIYNPTNGVLVTLDAVTTRDTMVNVRILGNSYNYNSDDVPFDTVVQLYNYNTTNTITACSAINNGAPINKIVAFNYNGKICIWFQQIRTYQTFFVTAHSMFSSKNLVTSITNSAMPTSGVTRKVDIVPKNGYYTNATTIKDGLMSAADKTNLNKLSDTIDVEVGTSIDYYLYTDTSRSSGSTTEEVRYKLNNLPVTSQEVILPKIKLRFTDADVIFNICRIIRDSGGTNYIDFIGSYNGICIGGKINVPIGTSEIYSNIVLHHVNKSNYLGEIHRPGSWDLNGSADITLVPGDNIVRSLHDHDPNEINIKRPVGGWIPNTIYRLYLVYEDTTNSAGGFNITIDDNANNSLKDPSKYYMAALSKSVNIITIVAVARDKVFVNSSAYSSIV